jgi:hypothetical protein
MLTSGILAVVIPLFTLVRQEFVYALTFVSYAIRQIVGVYSDAARRTTNWVVARAVPGQTQRAVA